MFNKKQLEILDRLSPYIDGEEGESRKGHCQMYPLIHITVNQEYWCDVTLTMVPVPADLVGDWIVDELFDENYYDKWEKLSDQDWKRAEQVEVKVTKWQAAPK